MLLALRAGSMASFETLLRIKALQSLCLLESCKLRDPSHPMTGATLTPHGQCLSFNRPTEVRVGWTVQALLSAVRSPISRDRQCTAHPSCIVESYSEGFAQRRDGATARGA